MKSNLIKCTLGVTSLLLLNTSAAIAENNVTEIDTLVVYSQGAKDHSNGDIETRINHLFTTTNKIYEDSGVNISLNAVKLEQLNLDDNASTYDVLPEIHANTEIQALRNKVGADEVVIYRPYSNDGLCGLAYYNPGYEAYAYAHVSIDCAAYVTGHEVGHNMHLAHSAKQDPDSGYGRGHGVEDQFTTVMAYTGSYNGAKVYKFSDPKLDCNGEPCGIEVGLENEADAVKKILIQAPLIANFREHVVIDDSNDTEDNNNKLDNNNTNDSTDSTDTTDLETAKKAYEDQIMVVDHVRAEMNILRANVKTVRTKAKATYQAEVEKLRTAFKTTKTTEHTALTVELAKLRERYLTARSERNAKTITSEQFTEIVTQIRSERTSKKADYKESISAKRVTLRAKIATLKEARIATIQEAKAIRTTFKTDVLFVEVQKLKELRKIYKTLLNASL
ncbi:MAG: Unknown protein [uncultured Sulfurovum sp.]|uniref:Uncharacterized protein n=1 Tax=uncultured Sulfurovum sp. TaxID=269237 RepID=A0A6S6SNB4_9BACT|nr:MAG: Unknown protein [uncultured Sulfurovum sp.]